MKLFITILLGVAAFLYLAKTTISLNPFKIKVLDWPNGIGWVLLVMAILLLKLSSYKYGVRDGYDQAIKDVIELNKKSNPEKK